MWRVFVPMVLVGCGILDSVDPVSDEPAAEAVVVPSASTEAGAPDARENRGLRVGGENGVLVGDQAEVDGVRVGGEMGVMAGDDGNTQGVRIGGSNGVVVGQDANTQGVRVGGKKGVEVDVKKGISIGGKKLIGRGR